MHINGTMANVVVGCMESMSAPTYELPVSPGSGALQTWHCLEPVAASVSPPLHLSHCSGALSASLTVVARLSLCEPWLPRAHTGCKVIAGLQRETVGDCRAVGPAHPPPGIAQLVRQLGAIQSSQTPGEGRDAPGRRVSLPILKLWERGEEIRN